MILGVQTIFCPDKNQFNRNIESIKSLKNFLSINKTHNINIVFIGWTKDEFKNELLQHIDGIGQIELFDKNFGKAYCVNYAVKKYTKNEKYLLNWDSDIIFEVTENFFPRLFNTINILDTKRNPWGLLSFQQKDECAHLPITQTNKIELNNERIVWPNTSNGIAGGCLVTPIKVWNDIGGYRLINVYGGNDGWYLHDCHKKGYTYQIWDTFSIIHPRDIDRDYIQWKRDTIKEIQRDSSILTNKQLEEKIRKSENFWKK